MEYITNLLNNIDNLTLIVSSFSLLINIYISTNSSLYKKKETSIKNIEFIMKNFLNELYINKAKYLKENQKIFDGNFKDFFIPNIHLIDYHMRILLIDIYKIEINNLNLKKDKGIKEKYLKSKDSFFQILELKFDNNSMILENEIAIKNIFWTFPLYLKFILLISTSIVVYLLINKILISTKLYSILITWISIYFFISFIISIFIYEIKVPTDNSKFYILKRYVKNDKKLKCYRCKKEFDVYSGTEIKCPTKHKFTYFKVINKNLNLLKDY